MDEPEHEVVSPEPHEGAATITAPEPLGQAAGEERLPHPDGVRFPGRAEREATADDTPPPSPAGRVEPDSFEEETGARERGLLKKAKRSAVSLGSGPAIYLENIVGDDTSPSKADLQVSDFSIDYLTRRYVPVPGHADMEKGLREHGVIALYGEEGSGRRSTAIALLGQVTSAVGTLHCEGADVTQALCAQGDEVLDHDHGYLVEAGDLPVTPQALDRLARLVLEARARLVVIGPPSAFPSLTSGTPVIEHHAPDAVEVLKEHLEARLAHRTPHTGESGAEFVATVESKSKLKETLGLARSMADVVQLAHTLADAFHAFHAEHRDTSGAFDADKALDDAVAAWRDRLPRLAKEMLGLDARQGRETRPGTYERAIRIAYALFNEHPLPDVDEAGDRLSRVMRPYFDTADEIPVRHAPHMDTLVPPQMRAPAATGPERAKLVDDELLRVMLETTWSAYSGFRRPFLGWLNDLTGRRGPGHERTRVRVAQIAGLLMRRDFDFVYRECVGPWARSEAGGKRLCAALAAEMAAAEDGPARRVAARVQQWAHSPSRELQDTAARAYGTSIGLRDLPATLSELTTLGKRPELAAASIAHSTAWLFLEGHVDDVMLTLKAWTHSQDEYLSRHAVRTMLALGRCTVGGGRPALAELALRNGGHADLLTTLCHRALLTRGTSTRTWNLLQRWLRDSDGDGNDDLARFYQSFATRVFTGPLEERARFHVTHVWRSRHPDSTALRRLEESLRQRTADTSDNAERTDRS
ncbi:hypothetical protein GCM10010415_27120 [Streptomyces atrovirens]|uniref:Uncharacterized protein n=1 Tax=Streptomyces atrovirens TaxID=285556 RepID=A0ABW0DYJ4_9ACTN